MKSSQESYKPVLASERGYIIDYGTEKREYMASYENSYSS
jgi:hypothetical protein